MTKRVYLDHSATTPMLPEVIEAMADCYRTVCANPSSIHWAGRIARRRLEKARETVGQILGAKTDGMDADQVIFTSGGTEANNLAILGIAGPVPAHLIISGIEHPSVTRVADELERLGWQITRLPASTDGVVDPQQVAAELRPETRLVSVMLANNETGVLQPVAEISAICLEAGVPVHTDAIAVAGKLPINFRELGVDLLTVSAHKFHGPIGVGVIIGRSGCEIRPRQFGGFQQFSVRPGTESVSLAVGLEAALGLFHHNGRSIGSRANELRSSFELRLSSEWPELVIVGQAANRLPHISNIAFCGLNRQALMMALDQAGVDCSTGSACASGSSEPSPVLMAMDSPAEVVESALRFSFDTSLDEAEVDLAVDRILKVVNHLRS